MKRVVLLHSALGDSRLWRRQIPVLEERFEVVAPDLPGYGTEPMPREAFSFVDRVAELLPALLVGNSFGGAVALQTALAHQDRVEKLVLVGAGFPGWSFGEEMTRELAGGAGRDRGGRPRRAPTDVNIDFWVAPAFRDEVRPQQRRALELQTRARRARGALARAASALGAAHPDARRDRRAATRRTSTRSRATSPPRSPAPASSRSQARATSSASRRPTS